MINCCRSSPRGTILFAIFAVVLGGQLFPVHAHGPLHERIAVVTSEIAARPQEASLYLQRAELYREHLQFSEALADLDAAGRWAPAMSVTHLARARVLAASGQTTNALAEVENFLKVEADHPGALVIRARCRLASNEAREAIADFTTAITVSKPPEPDLYLERARAQAAAGQFANAVRGLDEGVARLGAPSSLQLAAVEFERQSGAFADAVSRVDKILASQGVKEPWLVLRGEILAQAGRLGEARDAFRAALAGIDTYPPVRRGLDLTVQLQTRARAGLARVEGRVQLTAQHVSAR